MTDKDWSLTDCVSFLVMRKRRLTEALTADRHFEQAGFVALLK
jgi:predicted nucleic acid-binding protein